MNATPKTNKTKKSSLILHCKKSKKKKAKKTNRRRKCCAEYYDCALGIITNTRVIIHLYILFLEPYNTKYMKLICHTNV